MSLERMHFIVAGHIDHGKSTLIGRLLLEMSALPQDRIENLKAQKPHSLKLEYSHLTDALADEKAKGITIGVSQTVFRYKQNEFVFIDAPGHHEFLQNMITGAAKADMAFLIVDAVEGIKESTLRHLHMLSFLGVSEIVVLVNKMDLVDYSKEIFDKIIFDLNVSFKNLKLNIAAGIPISAYYAENLISRSLKTNWYQGPVVADIFEECITKKSIQEPVSDDFCFIVHDTYKNNVMGELISGQLVQRQAYWVHQTGVKLELQLNPDHFQGLRYKSFTLANQNQLLKRGDIILNSDKNIQSSNEIFASAIWFGSKAIKIGETLKLRLAKQESLGVITEVSDLIDSASLSPSLRESEIKKGSVFKCKIKLANKISFADFNTQMHLGRFILINEDLIAGAGKIIA